MPELLLESRAVREFRPGSTVFSIGVHAAIIAAVLVPLRGKPRNPHAVTPASVVRWVTPRRLVPRTTLSCGTACSGAPTFRDITVRRIPMPSTVAPTIPDIGSLTNLKIDWGSGSSIAAGASIVGEAVPSPAAGEPWTPDAVERAAVVLSAPEPRYPDRLRGAGVSGRVVARFVIDTTGRIEPASVTVVESTHELFERAVRDVLPLIRFRPASVGGRHVRMLVEMPFEFRMRP